MKRIIFVFVFVILGQSPLYSLDYYWVGGSGNWSDINHWSAVSGNTPMQLHTVTPTSNDNIILDSLSFPSTGGTININLNIAFCKNLIIRDLPSNVSIQFYGNTDVLRIFGDVLISDTISWSGNGKIMLEGSGTRIIQTSGLALPNLYLNSLGTTWLVEDSLRVGDFFAENGTLDLQGNLFHCDELEVLNYSSLKMDSSQVRIKNKYFIDENTTLDCHMTDLVIFGMPLTHPNYNIPFFKDLSTSWHKYHSVTVLQSTGDIANGNHFYGRDSCLISRLHFLKDAEIQGTLTADTLVLDSSSTMRVETNSDNSAGEEESTLMKQDLKVINSKKHREKIKAKFEGLYITNRYVDVNYDHQLIPMITPSDVEGTSLANKNWGICMNDGAEAETLGDWGRAIMAYTTAFDFTCLHTLNAKSRSDI